MPAGLQNPCSKAATIAVLLQGFFISAMVFPYNVAVDFRRPGYAALSPEFLCSGFFMRFEFPSIEASWF
ncbi:MAG TPA: hypothetical protein PLH09_11520, partial [Lentimicrobium sp.]|nr:hypothetical protein [Lentimicrobium sp.]